MAGFNDKRMLRICRARDVRSTVKYTNRTFRHKLVQDIIKAYEKAYEEKKR